MKREGRLFDQIADMDNLRLALFKAKRGKEGKPSVYSYFQESGKNLSMLHQSLVSGETEPGNYHFFTIYEPKERLICAASFDERVLHHAIINVCQPVFERFQIYDSYATRPGKGQYAALEKAKTFQQNYQWFCKLDIRKYFDSVDHQLLFKLLTRKFKDFQVLRLFEKIIDSYQTVPGKGLPIGNLTSQYFANFYLAHADHHIKEILKAKAYLRYMDDMVFWSNNQKELLQIRDNFREYLSTRLKLECKPECINTTNKGLPFLGYVLFDKGIRLNESGKKRFIAKFQKYNQLLDKELWDQDQYVRHVRPLFAFVQNAGAYGLRIKLLEKTEAGCRAPTA